MPSTTRGSILISTANDIGEALVEKLGGVGYSPNEWKEKYNLCGIAPVDSAPALSVLADSAGTGDERGSILIATADAIGAILNKKYNVLRGFKPKEWASACRKMKALEEGRVASASIASFSDGADTVPLTSCVCSIDANLDGKTAVNAVHAGVNLFNKNAITPNTWIVVNSTETEATNSYLTSDYIPVKANTRYFVSFKDSNRSAYYDKNKNGIAYFSFNGNASFSALYDGYIRITIKNDVDLDAFIVNEGNEQATFEAYKGETKTADLGRAVYGGSADIIKGEGVDNCTNRNLVGEGFTWSYITTDLSYPYFTIGANAPNKASNKNFVCEGYVNRGNYRSVLQDGEIGVFNNTTGINRFCVRDDSCTTLEQFLEKNANTKITYEVKNPVDFTFEPVKIDSFPGVNNIWNDSGNTAVEYYQAPTPYARKTATGGIANFSDQRTDLPLTKAIANIAPSIAGKSAVNLYRQRKNLVDIENSAEITRNQLNSNVAPIFNAFLQGKTGGYTISGKTVQTVSDDANFISIRINYTDGTQSENVLIYRGDGHSSGGISGDFYIASNTAKTIDGIVFGGNTGTAKCGFENWQLEVGSTASAFEPYQAPTTYTAELGETVYGGSVDFVSGEVVKEQDITTLTNDGWTYYATGGKNTFNKIILGAEAGEIGLLDGYTFEQVSYISQQSDKCFYFYASGANVRISIRDDAYTSAEEFAEHINGEKLVYTLATPTESAIPGRVISPIEGVNNYWNDAGGDTEIQYFESEA